MKTIVGHDAEVGKFIADRLGITIAPPFVALGFEHDGELSGGAVFNDYTFHNLELSIYGPGCMTRGAIKIVFHYAFDQLKVLRLTARTRRSNVTMRRMLPKFGFIFEGTEPLRFGPARSDDALRFRLTRDLAERWM